MDTLDDKIMKVFFLCDRMAIYQFSRCVYILFHCVVIVCLSLACHILRALRQTHNIYIVPKCMNIARDVEIWRRVGGVYYTYILAIIPFIIFHITTCASLRLSFFVGGIWVLCRYSRKLQMCVTKHVHLTKMLWNRHRNITKCYEISLLQHFSTHHNKNHVNFTISM